MKVVATEPIKQYPQLLGTAVIRYRIIHCRRNSRDQTVIRKSIFDHHGTPVFVASDARTGLQVRA